MKNNGNPTQRKKKKKKKKKSPSFHYDSNPFLSSIV